MVPLGNHYSFHLPGLFTPKVQVWAQIETLLDQLHIVKFVSYLDLVLTGLGWV